MKKISSLLFCSVIALATTAFAAADYSGIAKFNQDSALELMSLNPKDNVIYSGPSVYVALSMLANGAKGKTLKALTSALNGKNLSELNAVNADLAKMLDVDVDGLKLLSKNALWIDNSFNVKPTYTQNLIDIFQAQVTVVPFSTDAETAAVEINDWANKVSNGLIPKIIEASDASALVALINNAVYFKASWAEEFDVKRTEKLPFTNFDKSVADVDMMQKYFDSELKYFGGGSAFSVLELPYKVGARILLALPGNGVAGPLSVEDIASSFFAQDFVTNFANNYEMVNAHVSLPKLDFTSALDLNEPLVKMGLQDLFQSPDLKGISDTGLKVSYVKQDAALKVNEEGTEAAAITSIGMESLSVSVTPTIQFNLNRSFLFMIVDDQTDVVLFQGVVKKL